MSVYWYDEAIVNTLRTITGDTRVSIVPTDTLFRYVANLKDDTITFPLISLTRLGYTLIQTGRTPTSSQGYPIGSSDGVVRELQFIPIQVNYQLDVISRKRDDNDMIVDELIFYFINNPSMNVMIGKGADIPHKFSMMFNPDVIDNSDIESHMSRGEYFRSTMTFYLPDAKLWKVTTKPKRSLGDVKVVGTTDVNNPSKDYFEETVK